MSELLRVEKLVKGFGARTVLRGLDLAVGPGKVYGLLARNGEGKTTLIRTIMGVVPADSGSLSYKGSAVTYGAAAYKREIGYLPEDALFYGGMTVAGLLKFRRPLLPEMGRGQGRGRRQAVRAGPGRQGPDSVPRPAAQARLRRGPARVPPCQHPRGPEWP